MSNPYLNSHINFNLSTADNWEIFTSHRQRVMELILSNRPENARSLCVLGAGNCNDLDLKELSKCFAQIHLVDIDREALLRALKYQGIGDSVSIILHGGIDISGVVKLLTGWSTKTSQRIATDALLMRAAKVPELEFGQTFDVVVSSAVLTQLINTIVGVLGPEHPKLLEISLAIRNSHILSLLDLVAVGGTGVLISDFVSSDTCEKIGSIRAEEVPNFARFLISQKNFFTGANPFTLEAIMREDPKFSSQVRDVVLRKPWKWHIGPKRAYLVFGLTFRKASIHQSD